MSKNSAIDVEKARGRPKGARHAWSLFPVRSKLLSGLDFSWAEAEAQAQALAAALSHA